MSEEKTGEEIVDEAVEEIETEVVDETVDPEPEPVAGPKGHMTRKDWEDSGREPDDWISPKQFEKNGQLIDQINLLKNESAAKDLSFDNRLNNLNKLHTAQITSQKAELKKQLKEAVALADSDEAERIQENIDTLSETERETKQPEPVVVDKNYAISQVQKFNAENSWLNEDTPKTAYANARFEQLASKSTDIDAVLNQLKADVNKHHPQTNPRRNGATSAEQGSRTAAKKGSSGKVTMESLTAEEKKMRSIFPEWSDKDFLKSVADSRSA